MSPSPKTSTGSARAGEDFPPLDGLRAIAACAVLIGHLVPVARLQKLVGWGDLGVVLFFCLSGFLITHILLRAQARGPGRRGRILRSFYARRFLRIFPIYYLTIAVVAMLGYEPVRRNLARLLTYTLNFPGLGLNTDLVGASHLWSLSVEEQFYVAWPVILLFAPRRYLKPGLVVTIVAAFGYKLGLALTGAGYGTIFRPITGSVDSLALGALVAVARDALPEGPRRPLVGARVVGGGLVLFAAVTAYRMMNPIDPFFAGRLPFAVIQFFVVAITAAVVIAHVVDRPTTYAARALSNRFLVGIATISYGLYLYHFFMPLLVEAFESHFYTFSSVYERSGFTLLLTFATAIGSWFVIEAPLLRLKERFTYADRAPQPGRPGQADAFNSLEPGEQASI